jgi:drug/metabolite transporter (DMT)-like permease
LGYTILEKRVKLADFSLVIVALLWGMGFIAVEYAIKSGLPISLILGIRFTLGALAVLSFSFKKIRTINKKELLAGLGAGVILFFSFFMQTLGQSRTSVSNTAFITAIYVVLVPFIIWVVTKKPPKTKMFFLVFLTLIGVFSLTYKKGMDFLSFSIGDIFLLLCAIGFAAHIVYLGIVTRALDPVKVTFLQLASSGILGFVFFLASGDYCLTQVDISTAIIAVVYLGFISTAICYLLQTWAQTITTPSKAGIIMSAEGLFGSLFSIVLGLEVFRINIVIGGFLILLSVVLSEITFKKRTVL